MMASCIARVGTTRALVHSPRAGVASERANGGARVTARGVAKRWADAVSIVGRGRTAVARAEGEGSKKDDTLSSLAAILGEDAEAEAAAAKAEEEKIERELAAAKKERDAAMASRAANKDKPAPVVNRAAMSSMDDEDGDATAAQRGLAALSYLLPLLDGLKYSKFLLLQFPLFTLALLPLKPAIDLWFSLGFLQIIAFFALYLGVVQNQAMPKFVRFNAQQAILLDILLIVPDVLARLASGLGGDDAMLTGGPGLEAQVLMYNTVFLYVYLTSVVGAGASGLGKSVKLPIVGDAAESQINMRP